MTRRTRPAVGAPKQHERLEERAAEGVPARGQGARGLPITRGDREEPAWVLCTEWLKRLALTGSSRARHSSSATVVAMSPWREANTVGTAASSSASPARQRALSIIRLKRAQRRLRSGREEGDVGSAVGAERPRMPAPVLPRAAVSRPGAQAAQRAIVTPRTRARRRAPARSCSPRIRTSC